MCGSPSCSLSRGRAGDPLPGQPAARPEQQPDAAGAAATISRWEGAAPRAVPGAAARCGCPPTFHAQAASPALPRASFPLLLSRRHAGVQHRAGPRAGPLRLHHRVRLVLHRRQQLPVVPGQLRKLRCACRPRMPHAAGFLPVCALPADLLPHALPATCCGPPLCASRPAGAVFDCRCAGGRGQAKQPAHRHRPAPGAPAAPCLLVLAPRRCFTLQVTALALLPAVCPP